MKIRLLIALAISVSVVRSADANGCSVPMVVYARRAILSDPALSQSAIAFLRNSGPVGLITTLQEYDRSHDPRLLSVIDVLPGLYDPRTFVAILERAGKIAAEPSLAPESAGQYLAETDAALRAEWLAEARQAAPELTAAVQKAEKANEAQAAMRRAFAKSRVEKPLLVKVSPQVIAAAQDKSLDESSDATWEKLAAMHLADAALDAASIDLIRSQNPSAYQEPGQLQRTVENLQRAIAVDTVHNNYQLRRKALSWLRQKPAQLNVEELNNRVYAELFMTPRSDPWLGLVPEATYTALLGDGCSVGK